jgi:hypothetical protein
MPGFGQSRSINVFQDAALAERVVDLTIRSLGVVDL